jgi:hypothetical protein
MHVEESVDELIRKLENQGKKIKILNDNDDGGDENDVDDIRSDFGGNGRNESP